MSTDTVLIPAPAPALIAGLRDQAEARRRRLVLSFEDFTLDAARFELRRRGRHVPLAPQPYDLLWALASADGEVVSRPEIRRVLWGSVTFVDFDGCLNFTVRALRRALGDDARRPRYIEAIRGAGYRFVASVRVLAREGPLPPSRAAAAPVETRWPDTTTIVPTGGATRVPSARVRLRARSSSALRGSKLSVRSMGREAICG